MPTPLQNWQGPPRNQSPCEYSTLDLTGTQSELRTVQIFVVLEGKSWSKAFLPQHTATPKTKPILYKQRRYHWTSVRSKAVVHWPSLTYDLPLFLRARDGQTAAPFPRPDLGREWAAELVSSSWLLDLKGANLWCRQSNTGRRVFDGFWWFCMFFVANWCRWTWDQYMTHYQKHW